MVSYESGKFLQCQGKSIFQILKLIKILLSAENGRLTYLVPKEKPEKPRAEKKDPEPETPENKAEEQEETESLYDRFGKVLKRG